MKLAELILFGISEGDYEKPPVESWATEDRLNSAEFPVDTHETRRFSTSSTKLTPKPAQKDYDRARSYSKDV